MRRTAVGGLAAVGAAVVVGVTGIVLPTMLEPQVAYLPWLLAGLAVNATMPRSSDARAHLGNADTENGRPKTLDLPVARSQ